MGMQDRDWYRDEQQRIETPGPSGAPVTRALLIANVAIALITVVIHIKGLSDGIFEFGVMQGAAVMRGQIWRLFTATYLHGSVMHIFVNMLGLYFLGPALERVWGSRQFFFVYTLGGVLANVMLVAAALVGFINMQTPGLGASGSILTLLGAAAVLFPGSTLFIYFLFPLKIRTAVILITVGYVFNVVNQGSNYGGDLCHLTGLAVGVLWSITGGFSLSGKHPSVASRNSMMRSAVRMIPMARPAQRTPDASRTGFTTPDHDEVDRILEKISRYGMASLSASEKETLLMASRRWRGSR